jgi:hypothetical protein
MAQVPVQNQSDQLLVYVEWLPKEGGIAMNTQKKMVESFQMTHRGFVKNLVNSLTKLEKDIEASREIDSICTGEWCRAIEFSLDELAKDLYSISEPRWMADDYSRTLRNSRRRLHDLYAKYQGMRPQTEH